MRIKEFIKGNIPGARFLWRTLYLVYKKVRSRNTKLIFTEKYNGNGWGSSESASGYGSELRQTKRILDELPKLLAKYNIRSFLDIPCGDFNWMQRLNYDFTQYVGADIVKELIHVNTTRYSKYGRFEVLNLLNDDLPKVDVIFCRDCLVHLSNADVFSAIRNIRRSGARYLLTTTYIAHANTDILTGDWRQLNLQAAPFYFCSPIDLLNEGSTEPGDKSDKCLGLWVIDSL